MVLFNGFQWYYNNRGEDRIMDFSRIVLAKKEVFQMIWFNLIN